MPSYFRLTNEDIEKAGHVDMAEFLQSLGEEVKREGKNHCWYDNGQKVTLYGNRWFHQYERVGGNAINFVRKYMNKSFAEAVSFILSGNVYAIDYTTPQRKTSPTFQLPEKDTFSNAMYSYLSEQRGIDEDVIEDFEFAGLIYQSSNGKYKNVVFVGIDKDENPRHAHMRGTIGAFKGNTSGSLDEYSFHWSGTDNEIYLFEAPIDMMSFICIYGDKQWQEHTYAASCGVSDKVLLQCIKDNPALTKVHLCLDNDEPGRAATQRISEILDKLGIDHDVIVPFEKDWNEDLIAIKESEARTWTQTM